MIVGIFMIGNPIIPRFNLNIRKINIDYYYCRIVINIHGGFDHNFDFYTIYYSQIIDLDICKRPTETETKKVIC